MTANAENIKTKSSAEEAKKIQINTKKKALVKDCTFKIKLYGVSQKQKVTYKSMDTDVVSIIKRSKNSCTVRANQVGSSKINVYVKKSGTTIKVLSCQITVTAPAFSVRFRQENVTLSVGEQYKLLKFTMVKPKFTAETPSFSLSNWSLATISANNILTANTPGELTVTAKISNGKTDTMTITIIP